MERMRHTPGQQIDHPGEEKLLLLLDCELKRREARAIGVHLEQCPKCRAKRQALLEGLCVIAEFSQATFLEGVGAPPKGWSNFPALLAGISGTTTRGGLVRRHSSKEC